MDTIPVLIFRPKYPRKLTLKLDFVLMFLVFVCIVMMFNGYPAAFLLVIIFCAPLIIRLSLLLPNLSYIRLSSEGIEIKTFYRSRFFKWYEVDHFRCSSINGGEMIVIKYSANHTGTQTMNNLGRTNPGAEGELYPLGHSAEEMVKTMNQWKARYTGKKNIITH